MAYLQICLHVSYGYSVTKVIQHVAIANGIKSHARMIDLYGIVGHRPIMANISLWPMLWILVILSKTN